MRYLALVLLVACGSSSPKPAPTPAPAPAPASVPDGGAIVAGEDAEAARATFAKGFIAALAGRDDAAVDGYVGTASFCAALLQKMPDEPELAEKCETQVAADNAEALALYRDAIPETFVAASTEAYPIDPEQGIYMITVLPESGDYEEGFAVMILELGDRRYVVFPRKK